MYYERIAHSGRACDERGHATAEYAIGTIGAAGLAGVLVQLAGGDWFYDLVESIVRLAYGLPEFPTPGVLF